MSPLSERGTPKERCRSNHVLPKHSLNASLIVTKHHTAHTYKMGGSFPQPTRLRAAPESRWVQGSQPLLLPFSQSVWITQNELTRMFGVVAGKGRSKGLAPPRPQHPKLGGETTYNNQAPSGAMSVADTHSDILTDTSKEKKQQTYAVTDFTRGDGSSLPERYQTGSLKFVVDHNSEAAENRQ